MAIIAWDAAFLVLNEWASSKTDIHYARVHGTHPERQVLDAIHGECLHVLSVSDVGTVELKVREKPVPIDLRGATVEYEHERIDPFDEDLRDLYSRRLEFTFPEGEVWIFDEAPIDL